MRRNVRHRSAESEYLVVRLQRKGSHIVTGSDPGLEGGVEGAVRIQTEQMSHVECAHAIESTAQNNLGYAFEHGQGVPQDYAEALKLYRRSAEQGDPDGQRSLGHMYESGLGVPRDYVRAHMWFSLAFAGLRSSGPEWRERAENDRDRVAVNMTPAQIAEAEKLAGEWKPSK